MKFAEIVFNLPIDTVFHYSVPENMQSGIKIGLRAWVPFGPRRLLGYIIGLKDKADVKNTRDIYAIIDDEPLLSSSMLSLAKWMSEYYCCSFGEAIEATIPAPLKKGKISVKDTSKPEDMPLATKHLPPNSEQSEALKSILESLKNNKREIFLLHGITGSGKTEVYLQAIDEALLSGKTSIVLVPEIALTPQTSERFRSRFGDTVSVFHSRLTMSQRYNEWKRIKDGRSRVVVGARSAIFSPLENLGLIVIDEEHETTYKQEDAPRYHAREVAIKRAEIEGCIVILGSATPSVESYYNALSGKYTLIKLKERIEERSLPNVRIVDMRNETGAYSGLKVISKPLEQALIKTLNKKEQAILFLNRRGFSTFVSCKKCGHTISCKRCNVALVYHQEKKRLICHYCSLEVLPPDICPECNSSYIKYKGTGTEKVESELHKLLPSARSGRMDTDSTTKRGSHKNILDNFKAHGLDALIGTQMIAKGLDFPKVTLVGVISADTALNMPDFRAGERTFALLTQVAGRAGRSNLGGEVIIQTYAPEHYAIKAAKSHDYELFYKKEIKFRDELDLPPFTHMASIVLRGSKEEKVVECAEALKVLLSKALKKTMKLQGPAPLPVLKIRGKFRWSIIIKAKDMLKASAMIRNVMNGFRRHPGVVLAVDIDPFI